MQLTRCSDQSKLTDEFLTAAFAEIETYDIKVVLNSGYSSHRFTTGEYPEEAGVHIAKLEYRR